MKILFEPVSTGIGHLCHCLALAQELNRRGHTIAFAAARHHELIARCGFTDIHPLYELEPRRTVADKIEGFARPEYIARCVEDERALHARVRPDLVVADGRYTTSISARLDRLPLASLLLSFHYPFAISRPVYATADRAARRRPAQFTAWDQVFEGGSQPAPGYDLDAWHAFLVRAAIPFNAYLRAHGLPEVETLYQLLCTTDLGLVPSTPGLDGVRALPAHHHFIGPQPSTECLGPEPREAPDGLGEPDEPLVFVSSGGSDGPPQLPGVLAAIVEALRDEPYRVVFATRTQLELAAHPRMMQQPFVPDWLVLRRARLVCIHHGGQGTATRCMAAGVPSIAIPFHMEQLLNAQRIYEHGAGEWVFPNAIDPDELRGCIAALLARPRARTAIAEQLCSYRRASHAVDVIERALAWR